MFKAKKENPFLFLKLVGYDASALYEFHNLIAPSRNNVKNLNIFP